MDDAKEHPMRAQTEQPMIGPFQSLSNASNVLEYVYRIYMEEYSLRASISGLRVKNH